MKGVEQTATYLGLELEIRRNPQLLALGSASISELNDHLAEQDPTGVHVRHGNYVGC